MADIVQLKTDNLRCNAHTIEVLEGLLERAHSGEVQEIAYAVVMADRHITHGRSMTEDLTVLIGAVALLQSHMCMCSHVASGNDSFQTEAF